MRGTSRTSVSASATTVIFVDRACLSYDRRLAGFSAKSDASEHATFACSPFHGWTSRWPGTCRAGQDRGKANASGAFRRRRGAPLSGRLDQSGLRLRPSATSWQEGEQESVADPLRSFRLTRLDPEGRCFVGRADGTGRLLRPTARSLAPRPRPGRARRVAQRTPPSPRRPDKIAAQSTPSFLAGGAAHAFGLSSGRLLKAKLRSLRGGGRL
jgi:hypothetical protein